MITCALGEKTYTVDFISGRALREIEPATKMYARIQRMAKQAADGEEISEDEKVSGEHHAWAGARDHHGVG